MNKIVFLDFDGVITTHKSRWTLDKEKLDLLGEIIKRTGAKIVISSSWRRFNLERTIEYLSTPNEHYVPFPFPYIDEVIDITPRISFAHNDDKYAYSSVPRGVEIQIWLDTKRWREKDPVDNYVILDDDSDMLLYQKDHFIKTDHLTGLSKEDVERAVEILNKEEMED